VDGVLSEFERHQLAREVQNELDHELAAAEAAPYPDRAEAFRGVYADESILGRDGVAGAV